MALFFLRFLLGALLLATVENPRPGNFKIIGPGGGGAMFHPTVSPHDPNMVLVSCDMTGAYITHDGGKSWRNPVVHVVAAQLLAFFRCLEEGLRPDSPSEEGIINRVVEKFPLHASS